MEGSVGAVGDTVGEEWVDMRKKKKGEEKEEVEQIYRKG